jgi:hypothetical protein
MSMAVFRQRILLQVLQYGVLGMTTFMHVPCTVLYCTTAVVNDEQYTLTVSGVLVLVVVTYYFSKCVAGFVFGGAYGYYRIIGKMRPL